MTTKTVDPMEVVAAVGWGGGGSRINFLIIHLDFLSGFGCRVCFILFFIYAERNGWQ